MRERDLKGHLTSSSETKKSGEEKAGVEEDYQRSVALDYLKSWQVFDKSRPKQ